MLLEVKALETKFYTVDGVVNAVNGISYSVDKGECLAIVGESGSGKTVGVLSILRLIQSPPGRIVGGQIFFKGTDLLTLSDDALRRIRGRTIAIVFQDPMTSLNPVMKIGRQITEALSFHEGLTRRQARARAIEILAQGRHPQAGDTPGRLPASVLGRHAPARDDRHGAVLLAGTDHRGRADHRARRDDPGADRGAHQAPAGGVRAPRSSGSRTIWASSPASPTTSR